MPDQKRFKIYVAAYLILIKDGQILLSRRYQTGYKDGLYSLVSGHLDGRETTKQCIIREAKEEANLDLDPRDLKVVFTTHRLSADSDREYIDFYLQANKWQGDIKIMEPHKCDDLAWFAVDNLPANMIPEVKFALENIEKNITYGEFGW